MSGLTPQQLGDTKMDVFTRTIFNKAHNGESSAVALLETVAQEGSKNAEGILFELTRECQAATGERDFAVAFTLVSEANPKLHRAYLNANR